MGTEEGQSGAQGEAGKGTYSSASGQVFSAINCRSDGEEVALTRRSTLRSQADRLESGDELVLTELVAEGGRRVSEIA